MSSARDVGLTAAAAVVVVDEGGRVLLVQHAYRDRAWHLPGGMVDPGETPWQAAVRELEEEVGLIADGLRLTGVFQLTSTVAGRLRYAFTADSITGEPDVVDGSEIAQFGWFFPDALPRPIAGFAWHAVAAAFDENHCGFGTYAEERIR